MRIPTKEVLGSASIAMNIVGTPCKAVQRWRATVASVCRGSKLSPGKTIVAPLATQAKTPSTMPKQWYSGTGMHRRSRSPSAIARAE